MPENKKYLTFDNLSRYDKKFKQWYCSTLKLGCDPVYGNPFYLQSQDINYHSLSQQFPVRSAPTEEGLPMNTTYDLPMKFGINNLSFVIRANTDSTHTLLIDNIVIQISLDPTPEDEEAPDESEGTEEAPFILYLGDAIDENDWNEFRVNDNNYIYFNNTVLVVYGGHYLGLSVEQPCVNIDLNNGWFTIDNEILESLPINNPVSVSADLVENDNSMYQTGILVIINKDEEGNIHGVYVDNQGTIALAYINGSINADFTGYQVQSQLGIIRDVIYTPLMQEGYITEPKFTFNNQAFRFGNEYNIQFLINTPGTTRLDLLTGIKVYDVRNALPSQLYINYDSKSGYQLWYEGEATQLTLDQPQIISKDAVEIYYKLDTTNSTLSFYYNPMNISPESLRYLDDSGSLPVIWYANGEGYPYTLIIQDPNNPFQHRTVERGIISFTNASATALHFEFIGPNGVIRFSIELQDGQLHQEIDWTSYKFPYASDSSSDVDNGYSIHYKLCPPQEEDPANFPPESWPTHKTLQGDWNFMQELIHPRYTVIGAGGACEMNDSNQIINMWGDITIYVYDNLQE